MLRLMRPHKPDMQILMPYAREITTFLQQNTIWHLQVALPMRKLQTQSLLKFVKAKQHFCCLLSICATAAFLLHWSYHSIKTLSCVAKNVSYICREPSPAEPCASCRGRACKGCTGSCPHSAACSSRTAAGASGSCALPHP